MAKEGNYIIEPLYQGGYSSFTPEYGNKEFFTGYHMPAREIGITTDGRTANILQSLSDSISKGLKTIEVGSISPEVFESIPKQQLKEVNRLAELTGVDVSVHAPVVEPSGITQQGFSESSRNAIERQMNMFIERAHEINPEGNIPVVFHSSAGLPGDTQEIEKKPEETIIVNRETFSVNRLPLKQIKFPGEEEISVEKGIEKQNEESWKSTLSHLAFNAQRGSEFIKVSGYLTLLEEAEKEAGKKLLLEDAEARHNYKLGKTILSDSYREMKGLFELANKYATPQDKNFINQFAKEIEEKAIKIKDDPNNFENVKLMRDILNKGIETFDNMKSPPKIFEPLNDFAKEKSTETFANIALNAYGKFKDKAPIIAIENPPAGVAFSRGEELKEIVEESRKKFVEKAVSEGKLSRSEAEEQAKKLIGVTWDVGHINMLRKYGYESKDIIKEAEKIAPLVKHVHLSDNFGFEHTELPMGMGNVPIKEIMEKLGKEGFEGKKIVEAVSWYQHFKSPAAKPSLEAFGSPIYSMQMAPYWNQSLGYQQDYYSGLGTTFPQINYETFGAGFSQLPIELGGQRPGAQGGRMGGRGME